MKRATEAMCGLEELFKQFKWAQPAFKTRIGWNLNFPGLGENVPPSRHPLTDKPLDKRFEMIELL